MDIKNINMLTNKNFIIQTEQKGGPRTLVNNLIKGLNLNNVEVEINRINDNFPYVNITYDKLLPEFNNKYIALSGPNVINHTRYDERSINYHNKNRNYVLGSKWLIDTFKYFEPDVNCYLWEWGIDTEKWSPSDCKKEGCFIYVKNQNANLVNVYKNYLRNIGINNIKTIQYGSYKRDELKKLCDTSRFCIVLSRQESHPHFLLEILSMNVPCLVVQHKTHWINECINKIDVNTCTNWHKSYGYETTVNQTYDDKLEISKKIESLYNNFNNFNCRSTIVNKYNLKSAASRYLEILKKVVK